MTKKTKILYSATIIGFLMIFTGLAFIYLDKYSKKGIYNNVLNQNGYEIYEIQKPIYFSAYIESAWIPTLNPTKDNEVIELNKEINKIGDVSIIIESIMNRGNDIYFNFDATPYITYEKGEFLYNSIFNDDGTATSYNNYPSFIIQNNRNMKVDIGQNGYGPMSKFSFGVNIDNYDLISDGFTLEYNCSILLVD